MKHAIQENAFFIQKQKLWRERREQSRNLLDYLETRCGISEGDMVCSHSWHYKETYCEFVLPAQYASKFETVENVFFELKCKVTYQNDELKATIPYGVLQTALETLVQQDEDVQSGPKS